MIGLDGTNLANAFWMRNGSAVIDLVQYGNREMRPQLSDNFQRLWDVAGVSLLWSHSSKAEAVADSPRCKEFLAHNGSLHASKMRNYSGCLDSMHQWVSVPRVRGLLSSVVEGRATFATPFVVRNRHLSHRRGARHGILEAGEAHATVPRARPRSATRHL